MSTTLSGRHSDLFWHSHCQVRCSLHLAMAVAADYDIHCRVNMACCPCLSKTVSKNCRHMYPEVDDKQPGDQHQSVVAQIPSQMKLPKVVYMPKNKLFVCLSVCPPLFPRFVFLSLAYRARRFYRRRHVATCCPLH